MTHATARAPRTALAALVALAVGLAPAAALNHGQGADTPVLHAKKSSSDVVTADGRKVG